MHHIDAALEICRSPLKEEKPVKFSPREGYGVSAFEAPRGTLFHEYVLGPGGRIMKANIVTPTAQYLRNMEDDLKQYLGTIANRPKKTIVAEAERLIRSYDPCFSCSTHFLEVEFL